MSENQQSFTGPTGPPATTGSNPSTVSTTPAVIGTPPDDGRRRLEINIDRHLELRLYISPRLLRWMAGTSFSIGAGIWYLIH